MAGGERIVFLLPGQGSQYLQMGAELFREDATFRTWVERLDRRVLEEAGFSVCELLFGAGKSGTPFARALHAHAAIFVVEYALARSLIERGLVPDAILGVSLGEFVAAAVAEVLTPEATLSCVLAQATAIEAQCGAGGMLAILGGQSEFPELSGAAHGLELAGYAGEFQHVLSGQDEPIRTLAAKLSERGIAHQILPVSRAFHSSHVDAARDACLAQMARMSFEPPRMELISGTDGQPRTQLGPEQLWAAVREPMAYFSAIERLAASGKSLLVDLGPSGSIANLIKMAGFAGTLRVHAILSPFGGDLERIKALTADHSPVSEVAQQDTRNPDMIAYVFPGQGAQRMGMGAELFAKYPALVERASEILGYSVSELCLRDPERRLSDTRYTQPALFFVNALSYYEKSASAAPPAYVAGHSLGEYNALLAAGVFDWETGLRLVKQRGELMSQAKEGGMLAVIGLSQEALQGVLRSNAAFESIDVANYNSPAQTVLSGPKDVLASARPALEAARAKAVVPLNVSAAFHSRYMRDAARAFRRFLDEVAFAPPRIPVISNIDARPYEADRIREGLARQIDSSVQWTETIRYLRQMGVRDITEVGFGNSLTNLLRDFHEEEPNAAKSSERAAVPANGAAAHVEPRHSSNGAPANVEPRYSSNGARAVVRVSAPQNGSQSASGIQVTPLRRAAPDQPRPAANGTKALSQTKLAKNDANPSSMLRSVPSGPLTPGDTSARGHGALALGSAAFRKDYGVEHAYVCGSMGCGISSVELVVALSKARMLGFFGSAGLELGAVEQAVRALQTTLTKGEPYGFNLSPAAVDPAREQQLVELYLRRGIRLVEASGYLTLTPSLVRYRLAGLESEGHGRALPRNRVLAKVSRPEIAAAFLRPAPPRIVARLLEQGQITREQAKLGESVAMADDLCVEAACSGLADGVAVYATTSRIIALRDRICQEQGYARPIRVGAAGGIGTPAAAAAALMLGADFVLTGSINQCSVEAATSNSVKDLLQTLDVQDFERAPDEEFFEMGARAEFVRKGVFFPARANKLCELYRSCDSLDAIDSGLREHLERVYFRKSLASVYADVKARYPALELERAESTPKYKMALVFKQYFTESYRAALNGTREQRIDYQIRSSAALGAFNDWQRGTHLESWRERRVAELGERLMNDCAVVLEQRYRQLMNAHEDGTLSVGASAR